MNAPKRVLHVAVMVAVIVSLAGIATVAQPGVVVAISCAKTAPTSGTVNWSAAGTWSPSGVPGASDVVCLPTGSETVEVDNTVIAAASSIDIAAGAKLVIKGAGGPTTLTVTNNVTNAGRIEIGSTGSANTTILALTSGILTNTGTLIGVGLSNVLQASVDNQPSGTVNSPLGSPLPINKAGGVLTNSGTWIVNGQQDIDLVTSFTMAGGTLTGSAIFHLSGGTFDHTGGNITGQVLLSSSTLKPHPSSGSGTFLVTRTGNTLGSDISAGETVIIAGGYNFSDGELNSVASRTNNGTIQLRSDGAPKTAKLIFSSGTLTNNGTIQTLANNAGNPRVIEAPLLNNGMLSISYDTDFDQASATLIQNSGTTSIQKANVLDPEPTLDLTGSAGTFDLAGGTFTGTGTLTGQLQNDGGTVAPGSSPGILTVSSFTQAAGGTLAMEIGGPTAGTDSDRLVVTGNASLDGTLALTTINAFVPTLSFDYDVLTSGSQGGTFATVTGTNAGGGKTYVVTPSATAVKLTVTAPAVTRQPDGQIALGTGSFSGDNIYNTDGTNQSKSKTAGAGTKVTFMIKIQNDGTGAKDKFKVHATGTGVTGYTIVFKKGTTNITTAVVNGTYTTGKIAVGAQTTIKCIVTIGSGAAHASHVDRLVTLTSFNDLGQTDAVKLTVGRT